MSFEPREDVTASRQWYWRLQGAALCLLVELLLAMCWFLYQVTLGLAAMGHSG